MKPRVAEPRKAEFATPATPSAITTFMKSPRTISTSAAYTWLEFGRFRSARSCGIRCHARSIGPAISSGKYAMNNAYVSRLRSAVSRRR